MSPPRRGLGKMDKSAQRNRKVSESSEESDDSFSSDGIPSLTQSECDSDDEYEYVVYNDVVGWWLRLNGEEKIERKICIRIHLLSPFLFGIVPPGLEDKLIDWSYECGLLPSKDVQHSVDPTNQTFEAIRIVENSFAVIDPLLEKKGIIAEMITLKNNIVKINSWETAVKCAESKSWFLAKRRALSMPPNAKIEMGSMALILAIYHFAGHIQLACDKKTDVLKQYIEDCKLAEEKALEVKEQGNMQFLSENYRAAISRYNRAVALSPFNYFVYGNRAQSYQNLGDFRRALIDAKRTVILKPDWDKGQYRFKQAAIALYNEEGDKNASFLTFCVGKEVFTAKNVPKVNGTHAVKKENPEMTQGINQRSEEDSGEGSVPELVSADECDTSGDSDCENKADMPALVDDDDSDSDNSSIGESDFQRLAEVVRRHRDASESRRPKKMGKSTLELLRKQTEEQLKSEAKHVTDKKVEKVERAKKTKEMNNVEKPAASLPEKKTQIEGILREGSKALLDCSFQEATENYGKALGYLDTGLRKSLGYGDKKYVVVLYAYGTALIGLDVHKKLETATSTFENIVTSFKTIAFPLAYYGLGRIYHRQNRFSEAIQTLEKGLDIVQSRSNEKIYWPGTDILIDETKEGNMKVSFERIITECKYPPKADAICRFNWCTGIKKSIYCSDTDYKGYVRVLCTDACIVEYHIQCWKKLKSEYTDKSTDKDFLDSNCFTVDCLGNISGIRVYDSKGLKTEIHSEKPKSKKETKHEKTTAEPIAGSKKKKRSKKKEKDFSNELIVESKQNDVEVHQEQKCIIPDEKPPESGMFVLKKNDDEQVALPAKQGKGKTKKKKTKNVQSLDEFLGRDNEHLRLRPYHHDDEDYDEIPSEPFTRKPPEGWMSDPFSIPFHLQNEAREIESSLATFAQNNMYPSNDPWKNDSIREYVYSAFINLLKAEGSLHVMSEPMRKLLNIMPEEARILVQKEGGLRDFLAKSSLFTIQADFVTNFEDKFMTDLSKPYKKTHEFPGTPPVQNDTDKIENTFDKNLPEEFGGTRPLVGDTIALNINSVDSRLPTVQNQESSDIVGKESPGINSSANFGSWGSDLGKHVDAEEFIPMKKTVNVVHNKETSNKDLGIVENEHEEVASKNRKIVEAMVSTETISGKDTQIVDFGTNTENEAKTEESKKTSVINATKSIEIMPNKSTKSVECETSTKTGTQTNEKRASLVNAPTSTERIPGKSGETVDSATNTEIGAKTGKNMKLVDTAAWTELEIKPADAKNAKAVDSSSVETGAIEGNNRKLFETETKGNDKIHDRLENASAANKDSPLKRNSEMTANQGSGIETTKMSDTLNGVVPLVEESKVNTNFTETQSTTSALSVDLVCSSHRSSKNANIQNEVHPNHVLRTVLKESIVLEPKLTKEKGIQSKPSTKNKIIMTEAMNEPYKAEYEKLLRSCQAWENKYQELLDKNIQMEKKYGTDVINMEKKLQDCGKKIEVLGKQCERIQKNHDQGIQVLHAEKQEKSEQIKKLEEKLDSLSKTEEKQIEALKAEMSALEGEHQKEKQQWISEKESVEKLKAHSQKQAKRASTAEIQLLELQRDVNFSFFTRALQEAEVTLHNIGQILAVNPTAQLNDIQRKWQRYLAECKVQFARNKAMFEASIPQLQEGQPLSSLTSLRITRPAAYPGPPILHLQPPSAIPPPSAGKQMPPGPANIRPEVKRGPSPPGTSSQAATVRPDGIRPPAPHAMPSNQTSNKVSERPELSTKKLPEQSQKVSNSFEKIMMRLSALFPNYSRTQMTNFIKEVRASKRGSLTGLSFDDIVACVVKLVKAKENQASTQSVGPGPSNDVGASGYSGLKTSAPLPRSGSVSKPGFVPKPGPVPKAVSTAVKPVAVAYGATASVPPQISGDVIYDDDPCVICHDEMTKQTRNVSLDCGHVFHHDCIKKWLTGEQSTCPTCRVHALLPEEFPQLK